MRSFFGILPPFTGPSFIGSQLLRVSDIRMTGGGGGWNFCEGVGSRMKAHPLRDVADMEQKNTEAAGGNLG
ncbi:hypothetical protein [Rhizobium sp. CIAT894]|uniref:hypothetical protein n=1 Tax=Rhizobium sp. CIAT894 TaxID=2020312 RepID=UPI000190A1D3|nr:hypothetical protein [Rhizobium sp. CIAT894]